MATFLRTFKNSCTFFKKWQKMFFCIFCLFEHVKFVIFFPYRVAYFTVSGKKKGEYLTRFDQTSLGSVFTHFLNLIMSVCQNKQPRHLQHGVHTPKSSTSRSGRYSIPPFVLQLRGGSFIGYLIGNLEQAEAMIGGYSIPPSPP